jgi:Zn-finger nucleic acid-binding protein|tara:strand:+ start:1727 stop:2191 length:465 start_codon:yes stop_codon:yes gene_type:complete
MTLDSLQCPRDGSTLVPPEISDKSVFSRNGIFHCPSCSGLALNSSQASSEICSKKLELMHDGFKDEGVKVDISCPFCQVGMKVRDFAFKKIDGSLTELIEIDGCPNCSSFWLDAGELQRLSPPGKDNASRTPNSEASTLAIVLEMLLQHSFIVV